MNYETRTGLPPAEALAQAEQFFGAELGLQVGTRDARELRFEGGGGHVAVRVLQEQPTTLELETHEWDAAVVEFMRKLPR